MAAIDYGEGKSGVLPNELRLAYYVKDWGLQVNDWMNWPAGRIDRMITLYNYARAFALYNENAGIKGWTDANHGVMEMVGKGWALRKSMGLDFFTGEPKNG